MKIFFSLFLLIILSLNVNAILPLNIELNRNVFAPGETVFVTITKNLVLENEINELDFRLIRNTTRVSLSISLLKQDETYYLYFDIPTNIEEGKYFFQDSNILYTDENNVFRKITQDVPLEVKKTNSSIIAISPLFVRVLNPDKNPEYTIRLKNNGNLDGTVFITKDSDFIVTDKNLVNVPKLSTQKFNFILKNDLITKNVALINLKYDDKSYDVIIFINKEITSTPIVASKDSIQFIEENKMINLSLYNETREGPLKFKNFFDQTINNISFELTGNLNQIITLKITKLDSLESNEIVEQYLWINKNKNANSGIYSGNLILKSQDTYIEFPIYVKINEITPEQNITSNKTEIFEPIIKTNFTQPPKKKEGVKLPWTLIILMIVVIIVGILIFYFKKKKPVKQTFSDYIENIERK